MGCSNTILICFHDFNAILIQYLSRSKGEQILLHSEYTRTAHSKMKQMIRKIITPTDFSIESLNILKPLLNRYSNQEQLEVIFIHGYLTGNGITDLLFISKSRIINSLSTPEFDEALDIIRNKYTDRIAAIRKELFFGGTQRAFNNFLDGLKPAEVFIPDQYRYKFINKRSFELSRYLEKCTIPNKQRVTLRSETPAPEKGVMSELFLGTSTLLQH